MNTINHEIAHALTFKTCGRRVKPHGFEWQFYCKLTGAVPKRCGGYIAYKKYKATCFGCGKTYGRNKLGKTHTYWCTKCGYPLGLLKFERTKHGSN
jgi:predicted SprT family Zn-dependent metalloprotease